MRFFGSASGSTRWGESSPSSRNGSVSASTFDLPVPLLPRSSSRPSRKRELLLVVVEEIDEAQRAAAASARAAGAGRRLTRAALLGSVGSVGAASPYRASAGRGWTTSPVAPDRAAAPRAARAPCSTQPDLGTRLAGATAPVRLVLVGQAGARAACSSPRLTAAACRAPAGPRQVLGDQQRRRARRSRRRACARSVRSSSRVDHRDPLGANLGDEAGQLGDRARVSADTLPVRYASSLGVSSS